MCICLAHNCSEYANFREVSQKRWLSGKPQPLFAARHFIFIQPRCHHTNEVIKPHDTLKRIVHWLCCKKLRLLHLLFISRITSTRHTICAVPLSRQRNEIERADCHSFLHFKVFLSSDKWCVFYLQQICSTGLLLNALVRIFSSIFRSNTQGIVGKSDLDRYLSWKLLTTVVS